jgi:hypothetical protein
VGEDVVELTGDAQPFLVRAALRGRGPRGALAGPDLPPHPYQLGRRDDRDHPSRDEHFLAPGRGLVTGRRQIRVQPVRDQQVRRPEQPDGPPGGAPVARDDGGEHGDRGGEEHRPVRIAGGEVPECDGADAEDGGHRVLLAQQEQRRSREQQYAGEGVEWFADVLLVLGGDARADHDEDGEGQRRQPRDARAVLPVREAAQPRRPALRPVRSAS